MTEAPQLDPEPFQKPDQSENTSVTPLRKGQPDFFPRVGEIPPPPNTDSIPSTEFGRLKPAERPVLDVGLTDAIIKAEDLATNPYIPQEAEIAHTQGKKKVPFWVKAGAMVAGITTLFGIGGKVAYDKISSETGNNNGVGVVVVPETSTPNPTEDPATPIPPKTVEATPTVDHDKLPYEIGWSKNFGTFTVSLDSNVMKERQVNVGWQTLTEPPIHEVFLNPNDPNVALEKTKEGILYGMYRGWQIANSSRSNVTFDQYMQKFNQGEDLSFIVEGYKGDTFVDKSPLVVDPRAHLNVVEVASSGGQLTPDQGESFSFREVKGELYGEIYDFSSLGLDANTQKHDPSAPNYGFALQVEKLLVLMWLPSVQQFGEINQGQITTLLNDVKELDKFFITWGSGKQYSDSNFHVK